jgi:hypothetical protein
MLVVEENGAGAIYIVFDGVRIAKRGHPGSPQARTWVSLEPGFQVLDGKQFPDGRGEIFIYRDSVLNKHRARRTFDMSSEWEQRSACYGAMSEAEARALPLGEAIDAFFYTFRDPTPYGLAWYEQRPAKERFQMRVRSWEDLIEAWALGWINEEGRINEEPSTYDSVLAFLELGRRARAVGYDRTGQWLRHAFERERDRLDAGERELGRKITDWMLSLSGEPKSLDQL